MGADERRAASPASGGAACFGICCPPVQAPRLVLRHDLTTDEQAVLQVFPNRARNCVLSVLVFPVLLLSRYSSVDTYVITSQGSCSKTSRYACSCVRHEIPRVVRADVRTTCKDASGRNYATLTLDFEQAEALEIITAYKSNDVKNLKEVGKAINRVLGGERLGTPLALEAGDSHDATERSESSVQRGLTSSEGFFSDVPESASSSEKRLSILEHMRGRGDLDQDEYVKKRAAVLAGPA